MNDGITNRGLGMSGKRFLIGLGAALMLSMCVAVTSASAVVQRPFKEAFGNDGTSATTFEAGGAGLRLALQQASDRLYTMSMAGPEPMRGFSIATSGVRPQVGGKFPVETHGPAYVGNIAVDNSSTSSAGRLYEADGGNFVPPYLWSWDSTGNVVGTPFPIKAQLPGKFCGVAVSSTGVIAASDEAPEAVEQDRGVHLYTSSGVPLTPVNTRKDLRGFPCALEFGQNDDLFVASGNGGEVRKYLASTNYTTSVDFYDESAGTIAVDKSTGHVFFAEGNQVTEVDAAGNELRKFGNTYGIYFAGFSGLEVDEATNEVYIADAGMVQRVLIFSPPKVMPDVTTERPKEVSGSGAVFVGTADVDTGPDVTECFFEYGEDLTYSIGEVPCAPGVSPGTPIDDLTEVTAQIAGLTPNNFYNYRIVVKSANGTEVGENQRFKATGPPIVSKQATVLEVTSETALLTSELNPLGVVATYHYEYGPEACSVSTCQVSKTVGFETCGIFGCTPPFETDTPAPIEITKLTPGTKYRFRLVGENDQNGIAKGPEFTFVTFPLDPSGVDPCPNGHERKQTEASKLRRCRAYELVSAADLGGYDVASNLVPGAEPLDPYPHADDRYLYTLSDGKIPGIAGFPVNFGTDPYVAARGADGWESTYMGIPATTASKGPFASTSSGSDAELDSFVFAEPDRCSPCFGDGTTGIPMRLPSGQLVQGMKGSLPVAKPEPAGFVGEPVSADGSHLVFGSEQKFEPAGNAASLTIYSRDLDGGTTEVVSTLPSGATMTGDVDELAVSADGDRVLLGVPVRTDTKGNVYHDLYMHIAGAAKSVPVADTPTGVLYNGMPDDGSMVYFSTADIIAGDGDAGTDLFRAAVGAASATVTRVSTGLSAGNSNSCTPPENWNSVEGGPDCSTLAFAGGGGVASEDGTVYFLSPELLDGPGNGVAGEPNIYVAEPGSAPKYVGLIDNSAFTPPPTPPKHPFKQKQFGGPMSSPRGLAIDERDGSLYVAESGSGKIARFTSGGAPKNFSKGPNAGSNRLEVGNIGGQAETVLGVDGAPGSLLEGAFYVRESTAKINVYAETGEQLGSIEPGGGFFGEACGLAVDQSNGDVYVGDFGFGGIRRFRPTSNSLPITYEDYEETSIKTPGVGLCQVAVDSQAGGAGYAYALAWQNGPMRQYEKSEFAAVPPNATGREIALVANGAYVDPVTSLIHVNEGNQITVYDTEGELIQSYGIGNMSGSSAVAVRGSDGHTFVGHEFDSVREFGYEDSAYTLIRHVAVKHATEDAATRHTEDFQVTPDGDHAIFTTHLKLTETPTDNRVQVYRWVGGTEQLECTTCMPTGAVMKGDAFLAPNGTNMSDDGRVFFTSPEQLTLRDTNRRTDAYEWDDGVATLISTGKNIFNSGVASVDGSGKNVYFYTRQSISPQDDNGQVMKVYTARELGGFGFLGQALPCQASDECHGPGTEVAPPPAIGTYRGEGGNVGATTTCRKGFKKKNGKCVKKKKKKKKSKRHSSSRSQGRAAR
jgi:sugar lactone lactonase YvrE